jgi:hypothetical protein
VRDRWQLRRFFHQVQLWCCGANSVSRRR